MPSSHQSPPAISSSAPDGEIVSVPCRNRIRYGNSRANFIFGPNLNQVVKTAERAVSLSMEPAVDNAVELWDVVIDESQLMQILVHSNPTGLPRKGESTDPTETEAKPAE